MLIDRSFIGALGLGAAVAVMAVSTADAQSGNASAASPLVVELFTSQGCDSCPPADAYAGELAKRPDVLMLSLHVDYWDYLGWKDPYAQRAFSERQRAYSRALAQRFVYTPQMVIDGRIQDVGSDRRAIEHAMAKLSPRAADRPVLRQVGKREKAVVVVENPAGVPAPSGPATVWLVVFDHRQSTAVTRGELAGQTLPGYNVVRVWKQVGSFTGTPLSIPVDLSAVSHEQGCAIIVQSANAGPILAALPLDAE